MSTFSIRVELHNATEGDYLRLHRAMAEQGILRTGTFSGVLRHLPVGQYLYDNPAATATSVCEKARVIAATVRPEPCVLVAESAAMVCTGLAKVLPGTEGLLGLVAAANAPRADRGTGLHGRG